MGESLTQRRFVREMMKVHLTTVKLFRQGEIMTKPEARSTDQALCQQPRQYRGCERYSFLLGVKGK